MGEVKNIKKNIEEKGKILLSIWNQTKKIISFFGQNKQVFIKLVLPFIKITLAFISGAHSIYLLPVAKVVYEVLSNFIYENLEKLNLDEELITEIKFLFSKVETYLNNDKKVETNTTNEKSNYYLESLKIKKPIVIIIDDLDRVDEKRLWRIFTLLSLFDRTENLLFVIVGSNNYLTKILEQKYHVQNEGENFLTKFVAREFELHTSTYLDILVKDFINKDEQTEVFEFLSIFVDIPTYREYKVKYKQVLKEWDFKKEKSKDEVAAKIVKIYLKLKHPKMYELFRNYIIGSDLSVFDEESNLQSMGYSHLNYNRSTEVDPIETFIEYQKDNGRTNIRCISFLLAIADILKYKIDHHNNLVNKKSISEQMEFILNSDYISYRNPKIGPSLKKLKENILFIKLIFDLID